VRFGSFPPRSRLGAFLGLPALSEPSGEKGLAHDLKKRIEKMRRNLEREGTPFQSPRGDSAKAAVSPRIEDGHLKKREERGISGFRIREG